MAFQWNAVVLFGFVKVEVSIRHQGDILDKQLDVGMWGSEERS